MNYFSQTKFSDINLLMSCNYFILISAIKKYTPLLIFDNIVN